MRRNAIVIASIMEFVKMEYASVTKDLLVINASLNNVKIFATIMELAVIKDNVNVTKVGKERLVKT